MLPADHGASHRRDGSWADGHPRGQHRASRAADRGCAEPCGGHGATRVHDAPGQLPGWTACRVRPTDRELVRAADDQWTVEHRVDERASAGAAASRARNGWNRACRLEWVLDTTRLRWRPRRRVRAAASRGRVASSGTSVRPADGGARGPPRVGAAVRRGRQGVPLRQLQRHRGECTAAQPSFQPHDRDERSREVIHAHAVSRRAGARGMDRRPMRLW